MNFNVEEESVGTRVILYGRSSLGSPPVADQMEFLQAWARERGYTVAVEFSDDQTSGSRYDREGLNALLEWLARNRQENTNKVDWVVTKRLDRLGRDTKKTLELIERLKKEYGVEYVSATESMFDTREKYGELFITLFTAFADYERKLFREKSAEGLELARRRGVRFGRPPTDLKKDELMSLRKDNWSFNKIASRYNVSRRTISRRFEKWGDPNLSEAEHNIFLSKLALARRKNLKVN